jgi:hypothetical protein
LFAALAAALLAAAFAELAAAAFAELAAAALADLFAALAAALLAAAFAELAAAAFAELAAAALADLFAALAAALLAAAFAELAAAAFAELAAAAFAELAAAELAELAAAAFAELAAAALAELAAAAFAELAAAALAEFAAAALAELAAELFAALAAASCAAGMAVVDDVADGLPSLTSAAVPCGAIYRCAGTIVPAVSFPLGGRTPVETATMTAAAATPAPIQILRWPTELVFCSLMFFSPLKYGPRCDIGWTVADFPGIVAGASMECSPIAPITRELEKGWRMPPESCRRELPAGSAVITAWTRPSGG